MRPPHCARTLPETSADTLLHAHPTNRKSKPSPPARWPPRLPRRIAARVHRRGGYPNPHACHIRHAVGTHKYLYYDSAGQRRADV
ncbi:hypothetical protein EMO91_00495 [Bifidobacterium myosotis]|uniref:Uncharacterized protein n=1 Tax=Bifidobacterium myosotis TaxID=1630166 RepID=A0A5M9ZPZ5_9BIFI|nr:hypothetical protein EMO91_00495 [Bifidobacterium myosotis]